MKKNNLAAVFLDLFQAFDKTCNKGLFYEIKKKINTPTNRSDICKETSKKH